MTIKPEVYGCFANGKLLVCIVCQKTCYPYDCNVLYYGKFTTHIKHSNVIKLSIKQWTVISIMVHNSLALGKR
jgi:hypothetical protein